MSTTLQLAFLALALLSTCIHPTISRPSTSVESPHHHHHHHHHRVHHEDADAEDPILAEMRLLERQDLEDYPQQDMPAPADEAPDVVVRQKHKSHGAKSGRRTTSEQTAAAKAVPQETNDTTVGAVDDVDDANRTSGTPNATTNDEQLKLSSYNRERNRELRLNAIKEIIQNYRQGTVIPTEPRPTNVPTEILRIMNLSISHSPPLDAYPMKRQSFHPSCNLPNNTDVELWADGNSMNLLFNLTYPVQRNTSVTIIAATLRLFKFSQGNHTVVEQSCGPSVTPLPTTENDDDDEILELQQDNPITPDAPILPPATATVGLADDDKQIRVSIYWYTRSLKKNKVKRKLLDSRMLPIFGKGEWIEFNVRHAVRQWRTSGKNFGLVVEVENEDGELLKAADYFTAMNCSNEASTAKPLPGLFLPAAQSLIESDYGAAGAGYNIPIYSSGTGFSYNAGHGGGRKRDTNIRRDEDNTRRFSNSPYLYSFLFPVIDMCTVEVPAQEAANAAFLHHAQFVLSQHLAACKNRNRQQQQQHNSTDGIAVPQPTPTANDTVTPDNAANQTEDANNIAHEEHHHKRIRHERHRHRERLEETLNRSVNGDEVREEVSWTDNDGNEFRKIVIQEVVRSASPQRDSDR
ncbi:uncharacterized protein [Periplaneta americana]|uniref:uncharacterized protein isoform X2 n=1 Tax=Periplaneta americana TaxID=6978 RepID=UPI0037E71A3D